MSRAGLPLIALVLRLTIRTVPASIWWLATREPILEDVSAEPATRADRWLMVKAAENDISDERPDDCERIEIADLPCWPRYRDRIPILEEVTNDVINW